MSGNLKVSAKRTGKWKTEAIVKANTAAVSYNVARAIKKNVKMQAPVLTGHMKDSVDIKKLPNGNWAVYVGAYYGVYVEYGHRVHTKQGVRWVPAQPFFRPGVRAGIREWKARKRP